VYRCGHRGCETTLPDDATIRRVYCSDVCRLYEWRARRRDAAFQLFLEGSRLRAAGVDDRPRLDDIDAEVTRVLDDAAPSASHPA